MLISVLKAGLNQDGKFKIALKEDRGPIVLTEINQDETGLIAKGSIPGTTNFYSIFLTPQLDVFENQNILNFFYRGNAKPFHIPEPGGLIGISALNDSFISINTMTDAFLFNIETKKIEKVFSEGKKINNVFQDSEENLWFTTLGNGVYRLDKNRISNFSFGEDAKPVFCIRKIDSLIYIGSDNFNIFSLNPKKGKIERIHINNQQGRGRVTTLFKIKPNNIVAGTDAGLFDIFPKLNKRNKRGFAIKDAFGTDDGTIIASTSYNVSRIIPHKFDGLETIWKMRSTAIFQTNKTLYIGTLNDLYTIDSKKDSTWLGEFFPVFKNRINSIVQSSDSILWIAINGDGIVGFKNNRIIHHINENNGLTSNICRNIYLTENAIWVGTDKGLNRVVIKDTGYLVTQYTTEDGLSSNGINAVLADGPHIYVGLQEGLNYFDENKISKKSMCKLYLNSIHVSGMEFPYDTTDFVLPHSDNNIDFDYAGISFKAGRHITYFYRLIGLDSVWKTTPQTSLNYPSLPSGVYKLQVRAVNTMGEPSNLIEVHFSVAKNLFEKTWFRILLLILIASLTWGSVSARIKTIRKKENEKSKIHQKITELEQMALKSQMNPHFIFNCLNSIQDYVMDKDTQGANEFISKFSKLIRLTLDNSSRTQVSLAEEINYIQTYLELEQKRFENKFIFEILLIGNIDKSEYYLPPMMLQPYIENAIRHGIRYRPDNLGKIIIRIEKNYPHLEFTITDNGIGRKLSTEFKSKSPIEYQSKGMKLTASRIDMLNEINPYPILIKITDLEDETNKPLGTQIKISFPLNQSQNPKRRYD